MRARLLIAATFLTVAIAPLRAITISVTTTNDSGPGSLREALASAADGDTIDASGVTGTILLTNGELLVTNSVDIVGPGPDLLAVNGNGGRYGLHGSRVFHVGPSNTVAISSLTVTNGEAIGIVSVKAMCGGGIYNDHATLIVSNCTVSGSWGTYVGGGVYNDGSLYDGATLLIANSTLSGNWGNEGGGGIYNDGNGRSATFQIVNSAISSNGAFYFGGGIENSAESIGFVPGGSATLILINSTLSDNYIPPGNGGGGIHNKGATLQIINSVLKGNRGQGGAIYNDDGEFGSAASVQLINSTVISNSAWWGGGGIENNSGNGGTMTVQIISSTLSDNSAIRGGGGIDNAGVLIGLARVEIVNSTLSSNSAITGGGIDNEYATMRIVNSTLSDNSSAHGGNIYNTPLATLEIGSTILNGGGSGSNIVNDLGTITSLGYNLSSDDGGGFLTATGDQTNTDPMLDPAGLQDNGGPTLTIALLCGSSAIDQGTNFSGAATDQRGPGFVRTFDDCAVPNAVGGDGTDIGAYEVQRGDCPHVPTISCPTNLSVNARSPDGAWVTYPTPAASNGCPVTVICTPPSGSLFAIGDTIVSCIATDTEGNEATCSFTVHVKGAAEQIADLTSLVQRLDLRPWTAYFLTVDLQSASNALRRGDTRAACGDLDAFIFEVDVQIWWGQIWPPSRDGLLVRHAQRIQNVLGCGNGFGPGNY